MKVSSLCKLLPALLVATNVSAATLQATPTNLVSVISQAQPGDVVSLSGSGSDIVLRSIAKASPVSIISADKANPAVLRSLTLIGSSNLIFDGVNITFTPDMKTASFSAGVTINTSHDIVFQNATVVGGVAVNGVPEASSKLDATGNVLGVPTAYAINLVKSQRITLQGLNVSIFDRGIMIGGSTDVTVLNNHIHGTRRTAIAAAGVQQLKIQGNYINDIKPWHLGQTPLGDHADFMAFWTDPNTPGITKGLVVSDNLMEQAPGASMVLGPWMQGQTQGFLNPVFSGNVIISCTLQGFTAKDTTDAVISRNVMISTCQDPKQAPSIILTGNTLGAHVSENISAGVSDASLSKMNTIDVNNIIIPAAAASPAMIALAKRAVSVQH